LKRLIGNVLFGFDQDVIDWVTPRIQGFSASDGAKALGVVSGKDIIAGVVYERYNGVHVEASIAVDRASWANKGTLFSLFHYPFVQMDCKAISVLIPSSNLKSLNLATKLGFEPEAIVKYAAADGSSLIVLKMFKKNCKWIGEYNGKRRSSTESPRPLQNGGG